MFEAKIVDFMFFCYIFAPFKKICAPSDGYCWENVGLVFFFSGPLLWSSPEDKLFKVTEIDITERLVCDT